MPQPVTLDVSALCQLFPRPLILTGVLREILTRIFSTSAGIEEPDLRHLLWNKTPQTGILIESFGRWEPKLLGKRPAIILRRNAYKRQPIGLDDRCQISPINQNVYATLWQGSHTLFCIAPNEAQTELLATEVQRALTEFGPVIRDAVGLHHFSLVEIGALAELEESAEHFVSPVTVAYMYQQVWALRPCHATPIKTIALDFMFGV